MIQERLSALREEMKKRKIDIYIVPTADFHESEYVGEHFKARKFITGFTGSAGTAVITLTEAGLWTDGRYFVQAEKQLAQRRCGGKAAPASLEAAVNAARSTGHEFDSRGEYDYYMGTVLPKVQSGEVVKVELHRRFTMLPEKEYGNVKLPAAHYTPDFVLTYADGTVEVVEVKSKFTRRQQRDYIHRRRMFIDLVAEPQHWRFIEHITPDTAEEIRKWKRLAEQAGKDSSWEKAGQGCQHSTGRASRMQ